MRQIIQKNTMRIIDLLIAEHQLPREQIMLLRHSNNRIEKLQKFGSSVEEYTFVQSIGTKYDYYYDKANPIKIVVVIASDIVYGVYKILGIEKEGSTYELTSKAHHKYLDIQGNGHEKARRYKMEKIRSACIGKVVQGWEGRERTAIQRSSGGFFDELHVDINEQEISRP